MDLRKEAEQLCKDLLLTDINDVDYLESELRRIVQENFDYETEQGYFSTVIADAELEAAKKERALCAEYVRHEAGNLYDRGLKILSNKLRPLVEMLESTHDLDAYLDNFRMKIYDGDTGELIS